MQSVTGRVIVGLLWLTILVVAAAAWSAGASRSRAQAPPPSTRTSPVLDDAANAGAVFGGDAAAEPLYDLYGNAIEEAVGDYRVDFRGATYERHSPDTEVTQLAAPSM